MIPYVIALFCPLRNDFSQFPGAVPGALDWVEERLCQRIHLGVLSRPLGAFASCGDSDVPVLLGDQMK